MAASTSAAAKKPWTIGVLLFDCFELLDVFGPLEMFGSKPERFEIHMVAECAGHIASAQGPKAVAEQSLSETDQFDIIFVPGGKGTRVELDNEVVLGWLRAQAKDASYVLSVCTGSALLAKAGVLEDRERRVRATTNKMNFAWVAKQSEKVEWVKKARWVEDGPIFTSSGVSAGIDMTLAFIEKLLGQTVANDIANYAEYQRNLDADCDPFAADG